MLHWPWRLATHRKTEIYWQLLEMKYVITLGVLYLCGHPSIVGHNHGTSASRYWPSYGGQEELRYCRA